MSRHSNFGFSSILLAFVMICILTFSTLALISANSDYQLSRKVEQNNTAYYNAEEKAYHTLAQIDEVLYEAYNESPDADSYYALVKDTVPAQCGAEVQETDDGYRIAYTIPMQDGQNLSVLLSVIYPSGSAQQLYEIAEWKSVHETVFVEDEPFHLFGSEE